MTYTHPSFSGLIGFAQEDITPPVGIYARSWGAATHDTAEGIHRPLSARALAFRTSVDESPALLISLDLGGWKRQEDEWEVRGLLIESLSLDPARVLINLTHTHAGASFCSEDADKPGGHLVEEYFAKIREATLSAARAALDNAQPAVLEWSTGRCDLARNRDLNDLEEPRVVCGFNPSTPADDTLLVGRVSDADGQVLCVLANYACHPTTLAWQNKLISPDWIGAYYETIESTLGAPAMLLQGASGELQPKQTYTGDTVIADAHGRQFAYSVLATFEGMLPPRTQLEYSGVVESGAPLATWQRAPHQPNTTLKAKQFAAELPLKEDLPSIEEIDRDLRTCTDRVIAERLTRKKRIRRKVGDGPSCSSPVWIWQLGDAVIVAQRDEAYSQFQTELRSAFTDKTIIVMNLTNGSCGYLPPAELYDKDIYQVWQSPYDRGALETLTQTTIHAIATPNLTGN